MEPVALMQRRAFERPRAMTRASENPDRNSSAERAAAGDLKTLRHALDHSEPALPFNEAAKVRIGKAITDAVLPSCVRPPARRLAAKRAGPL